MTPKQEKCPHCAYRTTAASLAAHVTMAHPDLSALAALPLVPVESLSDMPAPGVDLGRAYSEGFVIQPTREAWMLAAVELMRSWFLEATEQEIPPVRISTGWPGGRGNKSGVVGQCWAPAAVADGVPAIFVSPVQREPVAILGTIAHELIHACGNFHHRGPFQRMARQLEPDVPGGGSWAKSWPLDKCSEALTARLAGYAEQLGAFPHSQITPTSGLLGNGPSRPPVQSTRMLKVACVNDGYTLRATAKWLSLAVPICPLCSGEMEVEQK